MRPLKLILFLVVLITATAQLARHVFVRWVEVRSSVLHRHERPLETELREAGSLEALEIRYATELERARKEAVAKEAERRAEDPDYDPETAPYSDEKVHELRNAIREWERKSAEILELRYFWLAGLVALLVGAVLLRNGIDWPGIALYLLAFTEMIWWTSPSIFGGAEREFTRLLDQKILFTVLTLVLLLLTWRWGHLNPHRTARDGAAFYEGPPVK